MLHGYLTVFEMRKTNGRGSQVYLKAACLFFLGSVYLNAPL